MSDFESGAFNRALPPLRVWVERVGHFGDGLPGTFDALWLAQLRTLYEDSVSRGEGRGGQPSGARSSLRGGAPSGAKGPLFFLVMMYGLKPVPFGQGSHP
jgi:hypothetical protein